MLAKWAKYCQKVPYSIRAIDSAEYRALKKRCKKLHAEMMMAYQDMGWVIDRRNDVDDLNACLKYYVDVNPRSNRVVVDVRGCAQFDAEHKCTDRECFMRSWNVHYFQLRAAYKNLILTKRNFWANKYARVK